MEGKRIETATPAPTGTVRVAWDIYPYLGALWRPPKVPVHLESTRDGRTGLTICGRKPEDRSTLASSDFHFLQHERDAGLCARCWGQPRVRRNPDVLAEKFAEIADGDLRIILKALEGPSVTDERTAELYEAARQSLENRRKP
jgi:hypothetical protein